MKRFIFACGLVGLIGCFLPLIAGISLFDLRHAQEGWHVWLVLAAFAVPTYVGATKSEGDATAGLVGLASFGYLLFKFGTGIFDLFFHAAIGGILMGLATLAGLTFSLLTLAVSDRR